MTDPYGDPTRIAENDRLEAALIGKLMLDQNMDGVQFLQPEHFSNSIHRELYRRMCDQWGRGLELDPVLVSDNDSTLYCALIDAQDVALQSIGARSSMLAARLYELAQTRWLISYFGNAVRQVANGESYANIRQQTIETLQDPKRKPIDVTNPAAFRFSPYSLDELLSRPPKQWLLDQWFGPGDLGEAFGPPASAKTYGIIDMIFCCSLGRQFAMRFDVTRPMNVAYCAGEGLGGLPARFQAAAQHYGVDHLPNFTFFELVPQLYENNSPDSIVRFVAEWKTRQDDGSAQPLDLLVIDTQHSATLGADENSAQDMGRVLSSAKYAIKELGCAVILVHHTNKAGTGERGSSAMRGAMDFMIEFKPVAGKFMMSCEKLKDAAAWKPQTFDLIQLGDAARVWWDEPQVSDRVANKQDQDIDAILTVLRNNKGKRYAAPHIAEAIGMGGSKQVFKLLPKAMREDAHVHSGLKFPDKEPSSRNPLVYWYGHDDSHPDQ